jgi:hypothetical protein
VTFRPPNALAVDWAAMSTGEDWLWRPVLRGLVGAEQIDGTTLDLNFFADLNEALDVEAQNSYLAEMAMRERAGDG